MSVKELTGALRAADKNGNKQVLYPMTKIDLVDGLRGYLESLEVSKTASGSLLAVDDSANLPFIGLNVYGQSTQNTTTGAQLWNHETATEQTQYGVTYIYDNGVYTINGTSDRSFNFIVGTISLEAGPYTLSANNTSHNGNSEQALIQVYSMTTLRSLACLDNKVDSFGTQEMTAGVDYELRIRIDANVTYNNFIIKPMLNKGSSVLPWELYTGGKPSPNPDFPQEIANVGDVGSIDVKVCGKNLLNLDECDFRSSIRDGNVLTSNIQNTYYSTIVTNSINDILMTARGKAITFSFDKGIESKKAAIVIHGMRTNGMTYQDMEGNPGSNYITMVIADDFETITEINLRWNRSNTPFSDTTTTITNVQLELGSVATEYEPYKIKPVLTISTPNGLPGINVTEAALANYTDSDGNMWCCDEVDFGRGVYVKRIGELNLDGSGNETINPYAEREKVYGFLIRKEDMLKPAHNAFCTHFKNILSGISVADEECFLCGAGSTQMYIMINKERLTAYSVDAFNNWLSANPVTVLYQLSEPIETPLSDEELAKYAAIHTNCPNTTVLNDKNADMSMTYYSERYDKAVDFIMSKIEDNQADIQAIKDVTEVTLLASNWSGSAAPYTQTVDVTGITEDDNPLLVSALYDGASLDAQKAYSKAFGIVSSGVAVVDNGSVTFKVYKLPVVDITVGLKGV